MEIEWDRKKAISNLKKHGVDFADVVTVLEDERAITISEDYPDEERLITIGMDSFNRILVVVYGVKPGFVSYQQGKRQPKR